MLQWTVVTRESGQVQVGQTVRVRDQSLGVIGVLKAKGGGVLGSVDEQAFVPVRVAQQRLFGGRTPDGNAYLVSSIALSANSSDDLAGIQRRVQALLRERLRRNFDGANDDFQIIN